MATRRTFLQGGLGLSVLPLLNIKAHADTQKSTLQIEHTWVDTSLEAGRAFADRAGVLGANVIDASQAETHAFAAQLDLEWRDSPVALAGVTTHGPMFVLEMLGRRHGMRLAYAAKMMRWADNSCGVEVKSAAQMCTATPEPGISDAAWAIEMANFALTTPTEQFKEGGKMISHQIGDRVAAPEDDPLFVWVIAPVSGAKRFIAPA